MTTWQVQSAKQRFSEMLRAAESGEPQFITKHGNPVAVLVDIIEYHRAQGAEPLLADFLLTGPAQVGIEIDLPERTVDPDRTADLFVDAR